MQNILHGLFLRSSLILKGNIFNEEVSLLIYTCPCDSQNMHNMCKCKWAASNKRDERVIVFTKLTFLYTHDGMSQVLIKPYKKLL